MTRDPVEVLNVVLESAQRSLTPTSLGAVYVHEYDTIEGQPDAGVNTGVIVKPSSE